jgi:DtxR family transcriptional regulator, Mn-dependent transcriptional regulator
MTDRITESMQDYLKVIFMLTLDYGLVSTSQIAERMGVAPASVTGMLQKLADESKPALVIYQKYHGVTLTSDGKKAALEVIRHHRLLELYLQQALGYSWDQVHQEADRLEHVISEEFEEKIAQALGDPNRDPHGEPIPTRDLKLPSSPAIRLSDLNPGQEGRVQRIADTDPNLLRHLANLGLVPQTKIKLRNRSSFDENITLWIGDSQQDFVLGPRLTQIIFIEE